MWLLRNSIFVFLFLALSLSKGQTVLVQDESFADALCEQLPALMTDECSMLDTTKAKTFEGKVEISEEGVSRMDEIVYFKKIDSLWAEGNNIEILPNFLKMPSLKFLNVSFNPLVVAPQVKYYKDGKVMVTLEAVRAAGCGFDELPVTWYENNTITKQVHLHTNYLTELPNFISYVNLRKLHLYENLLDFSDLIPLKKHSIYSRSNFFLFPQRPFQTDFKTIAEVGEVIEIEVPSSVPDNTFYFFKDDELLDSNTSGEFSLTISGPEDEGEYHFEIRNPSFTLEDEFLISETYRLKLKKEEDEDDEDDDSTDVVDPDPVTPEEELIVNNKKNDVLIFSPNNDGVSDVLFLDGTGDAKFYSESGLVIKEETLPFKWDGSDAQGSNAPSGLYLMRQEDGSTKKILLVR